MGNQLFATRAGVRALGLNDNIPKPFNPNELYQQMARLTRAVGKGGGELE